MESSTTKILSEKPVEEVRKRYLNLSVSKIKVFKGCTLQFLKQYIEKLPKKDTEYTYLGKFLHAVFEYFNQSKINKIDVPDNILISRCFQWAYQEWKENITSEQLKSAKDITQNYLRLLHKIKTENNESILIGAEDEFFVLILDKYLLNGLIDVIQIDQDGICHVIDYKSADLHDKKKPDLHFTKTEKYKRYKSDIFQLKIYAYVMFVKNPEMQIVRCSYSMMKHDFFLFTREFKREDMLSIENEIIEYGKKIEAEKLYRAKVSILCTWCSFLDGCEAGKRYLKIPIEPNFGETDWS